MNGQSGPPPGITDMSPDMRLQAMQAAALSHGFYNFNMPVTSPTMLPSPSSSVGSPSGKWKSVRQVGRALSRELRWISSDTSTKGRYERFLNILLPFVMEVLWPSRAPVTEWSGHMSLFLKDNDLRQLRCGGTLDPCSPKGESAPSSPSPASELGKVKAVRKWHPTSAITFMLQVGSLILITP